ncbi:LOW QUALITY PROTEIN: uncharacterized protein LOC133673308 [Populus nigra]|uniref:LOW QUALITY PROTEIN: uncharacterized protein LOC133673308 n=1 Tax=Populus nigra TaxID=3691 RepID=UPI002B2648A9|nr:LOW QUALITY PROTEIN: uncharacterized protein LOC133673308 [Populus nigra]
MAMEMKFLDWYVKISAGGALIGASMELFMIKTGFYDKVTVLESERRAWESSPEAQAIREALNPWRNHDTEQRKMPSLHGPVLWLFLVRGSFS